MSFDDAMAFVEGHGFPPHPTDVHARRTRWLMARSRMGERLAGLPVVVVAGSCGKASTARFLAYVGQAALRQLGDRRGIGLGTKPPLSETPDGNRERYQVLWPWEARPRWVDPTAFEAWVEELRPLVHEVRQQRPELGPVAAYDLRFWLLARSFVDQNLAVAIVEANIGLRRDPAATFPGAALFGLTPVGNDHAPLLTAPRRVQGCLAACGDAAGPAWHKGGGVGRGLPLVLGRQAPAVESALLALARSRQAGPVYRYGVDYEACDIRSTLDGTRMRLRIGEDWVDAGLAAVGGFHAWNAAQAAMLARVLQQRGTLGGDLLAAVRDGLAAADSPGRADLVARAPTTVRAVAMSLTKIEALCDAMATLLATPEAGDLWVCASFLERVYRVEDCVKRLASLPRLRQWCAITPPSTSQGAYLGPDRMVAAVRQVVEVPCPSFSEASAATAHARAQAGPRDVILWVGDGTWF